MTELFGIIGFVALAVFFVGLILGWIELPPDSDPFDHETTPPDER